MLVGIIGKPSSGKSTFFNAACMTNVKTADYPFTTIDPNLGKSYLRAKCVCKEFGVKDNPKNSICINNNRFIPIKILDVAGLVPDAHLGKGMGNQFLSDLARADALIHVVDISGNLDAEGNELKDEIRDPLLDIKFLEEEINFWFRDLITKDDWNKFVRKIEQEKLKFSEMILKRLSGIGITKIHIQKAIKSTNLNFERLSQWSEEEVFEFSKTLREISKPIIIAANKIDKPNANVNYTKLKEKLKERLIPCSGLAEFWLRKYQENNIINYLPGDSSFVVINKEAIKESEIEALGKIQDNILDKFGSTGVQNVLNYIFFEVLQQIIVYPVYDLGSLSDKDGNILPDAHLISNKTHLKEFVDSKIHSDLAKNFIYGLDARTKLRLGENYELKNNDVIRIVSAAK